MLSNCALVFHFTISACSRTSGCALECVVAAYVWWRASSRVLVSCVCVFAVVWWLATTGTVSLIPTTAIYFRGQSMVDVTVAYFRFILIISCVSFTLISQLVGYGLLFSIASVRPACCSCACFYGVGDSILRLVPPFHVVQWCALLLSLDRLVAASSLVWNCSLGFPASLLAPCRVSLRFTCNRNSLLLQSWLAR